MYLAKIDHWLTRALRSSLIALQGDGLIHTLWPIFFVQDVKEEKIAFRSVELVNQCSVLCEINFDGQAHRLVFSRSAETR